MPTLGLTRSRTQESSSARTRAPTISAPKRWEAATVPASFRSVREKGPVWLRPQRVTDPRLVHVLVSSRMPLRHRASRPTGSAVLPPAPLPIARQPSRRLPGAHKTCFRSRRSATRVCIMEVHAAHPTSQVPLPAQATARKLRASRKARKARVPRPHGCPSTLRRTFWISSNPTIL